MRHFTAAWIVVVVLLGGCDKNAELRHARVVDPPRPVATFELTGHTGAPFSRDDLMGRWTVLFSGFTHCPDICPATLGILKAAGKGLDASRVQTVFVSVDPERDTLERLAGYLAWFDEDWIGLTGEREALDRLLDSLQMAYVRVPTGNGEYTMDHATAVALIDPQGRMTAFWSAPLDVGELREDLASLPAP
ncbi:SCO family protein [Lentisalinibacter salinarum]|uniref:SCO family protein n=1 Tax=Lentisalinibacter salinarum TaxID=2992239 RepID=UPI00386AA84B